MDAAVSKLTSEGHSVSGVVCHVGKKEDRDNLIQETVAKYGGLDILVSNAAVNPYFGIRMDRLWSRKLMLYILFRHNVGMPRRCLGQDI